MILPDCDLVTAAKSLQFSICAKASPKQADYFAFVEIIKVYPLSLDMFKICIGSKW